MNKSEIFFRSIFKEHAIRLDKIPESLGKTPDYKSTIGDQTIYWEVKELKDNEDEKSILSSTRNEIDDCYTTNSKRVENSIRKATKQFKQYGVTGYPCIITLFDARDFLTKDHLFKRKIRTLMCGTPDLMNINGELTEINRKPGLLTNRKKYISAITVINEFQNTMHCFHNPNSIYSLIDTPICKLFDSQESAIKEKKGLIWVDV